MKGTQGVVRLFLTLQLYLHLVTVEGIRCYVCNDCEIYYNETQLIECDKDNKCIKRVEAGSELVSRDCGDLSICIREASTPKNSSPGGSNRKSAKIFNNSKKRRSPPLLSIETTTTPRPPPPSQISSLHCCDDEDGCNGATINSLHSTMLLILILIVVPFVMSYSKAP